MTCATPTIVEILSIADAWRELTARSISIVPSFDGRIWTASVDEKGNTISTKKRKVRMVSATASTPLGAISALVAKLEDRPRESPLGAGEKGRRREQSE